MSQRIKRNLPFLKLLLTLKPKERRSFLCRATEDLILALCEICFNVLKGKIPLSSSQYAKLNKQKKFIKMFANRKSGIKHKRKVVTQSGGFIPALLSVALPFLASLITGGR